MRSTSIAAAILAGSAILVAGPAFAVDPTSSTSSFSLGLRVYHECTIETNAIDFGDTGITDAALDETADVTVDCTERSPYAIALDAGLNGAGDTTARKLKNGAGDTISYQLYSDGGTANPWGADVGHDTVDSASSTQAATTYHVHAVIPAFHNKPAGTYSDTITATIWYGGGEVPSH
jgi:spore coat protein U-like protein